MLTEAVPAGYAKVGRASGPSWLGRSVPSPRIRAPWRVQAAFGVILAVSMATSRYFSERKMAELHDAALRRGASCCHDWAELEKTAGKMVESSLELADRVESA